MILSIEKIPGILWHNIPYIISRYISQVPFSGTCIRMGIIQFLLYKFTIETCLYIK